MEWGKSRHGTPSGYSRHQALGERPCDACFRAKSDYDRRWRAAPGRARLSRINSRAQKAASSHLAAAHPDEYQALYQEAKARLMAEETTPQPIEETK